MDFGCCVTKATNTGSEGAIVSALPRQQQLHHSLSTLSFTYISVLVLCFPLFYHIFLGSFNRKQVK